MELTKLELFEGISEEEISEMIKCSGAIIKNYKADTFIFRNHEKPVYMFVILEGSAIISRDFSSGRQDILLEVSEGDVLGETFFSPDRKEYWYDAVSHTPVKALLLPFHFFYGFCGKACEKHQNLVKNMLGIFSERNYELTRKAHILSCNNLREKIVLWLLGNCDKSGEVKLNMNREELSAYLGVTRPSLSRELMKMQEDGLIDIKKNSITIIDDLEEFKD